MNNNSSFQSSASVECCWYKLAEKKCANISSELEDKKCSQRLFNAFYSKSPPRVLLCSLFFKVFCCFSTIKSLYRQNYATWCRSIKNTKAQRVKFVRERTKQSRTVETFDLLSVASNNSLTVVFPVTIVSHSKLRGILTGYAIAYVNLENCLYQVTETVLGSILQVAS